MARIIKRCRETINDFITPTYITTSLILKVVQAEKPTDGIAAEFAVSEEIKLNKVQSIRLDNLSKRFVSYITSKIMNLIFLNNNL